VRSMLNSGLISRCASKTTSRLECHLFLCHPEAKPRDLSWKLEVVSVQRPLSMNRCTFLVRPSEAEGPAVPRTSTGGVEYHAQTELSSQPEHTRISCHAALDKAPCAPFFKERRTRGSRNPLASTGNRGCGAPDLRQGTRGRHGLDSPHPSTGESFSAACSWRKRSASLLSSESLHRLNPRCANGRQRAGDQRGEQKTANHGQQN
jgi:hypothetical protein